jgi:hypothetical protein
MFLILEKEDSENQKLMAEALLANGLVSAIERYAGSLGVKKKSDEEVLSAVTDTVRLFGVGSQWTAVYRVLVDFCGWESDIVAFCRRMDTLLKDVVLHFPCNYQAIQKTLSANSILRKEFREWKRYKVPEGDRVFPRQMFIAEKLLKLLSIGL